MRRTARAAPRSTPRCGRSTRAAASRPSTGGAQFSLILGLERLLSEEEPHLADGTTLSAHQVDALSGTLIALEAELLISRNGTGNGKAASEELHSGELELEGDELPDEEPLDWDPAEEAEEEAAADAVAEDPGAARRFWFEHATGAGKTVAALGFVEASRTGGILILTHRRNLVDQFLGELRDRGYKKRISAALLKNGAGEPPAGGPVTVETYQWFVRNAGKVSDAYTIVICDEAHTALGEKTSGSIRQWIGPVFVGMTATGALIARHVTDLFPTQTSRFDLAQAARRGVIAPLRSVRIPPGVGVRSIANVPLRRGEVDQDFDQEELAELLDQTPFNLAVADLYKTRFKDVPGVVYSAGVKHAHNVAKAFQEAGMKAKAVSGETPKRELTRILAAYERGEIDVLVNAQLLAEGWNSPRATVCMHLAPTASKRIYQQRVGRVTRRNPGKESGIVVDFVHPATPNDDPVVTLHSLLDRDVYRGGAIVVGPVRRGRGRRLRVERRVVPVTADQDRRAQVFERELWRIAVEHLSWGEQQAWAMLAGARVASNNWRRAKAMLHFDQTGELRRIFLDHLPAPEPQHAAAPARARRGRQPARRRGVRRRRRDRRRLVARRAPRGREGAAPGAHRAPDRPPRPGGPLALAPRRVLARGARGVRGAALAGDEAPARPARELRRRGARAQRAPARAGVAQAGPAPVGRAARGRSRAHARGAAGAGRRPHADGPQAERARARAAAQLPEGQAPPRRPPPQEEGRGRGGGHDGRHRDGERGAGHGRRDGADDGGDEAQAPKPRRKRSRRRRPNAARANGGRDPDGSRTRTAAATRNRPDAASDTDERSAA